MKKFLLTLSLGAICFGTQAQVWTQNFNGSGLPTGWAQINDGKTPASAFTPAVVAKLTANAWAPVTVAAGDSAMITTSYFTPAGKADRWLISQSFNVTSANTVLFWDDYAVDAAYPDSMQILISTTAGTSASDFTQTLYNESGTIGGFGKHGVSLAAYNGQTVRVAFRDNSTDEFILYLDNAGTAVLPNALDASVDSVSFPTLAAAGSQVKVLVGNAGAQNITAVTLTYQVDAGTPVSQTFTGLNIAPFGSQMLTFSTAVTAASGPHTILVTLTQTNGAADPVTTNNTKARTFVVPTTSVPRAGLLEEFTSSTCVPCAAFNVNFDPLITSTTNNANDPTSDFNVIKYQMNWPAPGNDVSYNPAGLARRIYYNVNSIPDHFTNGMQGGAGDQSEITSSKSAPAYMSITGTYIVQGDTLYTTVNVTPNFTVTGANTKVRMAVAEKHYTNNGATTTQKEYFHVMRVMIPDANGIAVSNWTSGVTQTFTYKTKYNVGSVAQGNYNFWADPINSNLVAFVQDDNSQEIYQSKAIPAQNAAGVGQIASVQGLRVFPNPASNVAHLEFNLTEASLISVSVTDVAGRVVSTVTSSQMNIGAHEVSIPTNMLAAGLYNIVLRTANGTVTERLSVIK